MEKFISFSIPFRTQQVTEESWQSEGFVSIADGRSWEMRGCGIASLRMVVDGFLTAEGKPSCGGQGTMIYKGLEKQAYLTGVGWIHQGLATLAEEFDLIGTTYREKSPKDVARAVLADKPCIVSVTPRFEGGQPNQKGGICPKGGHLAVVYGCDLDKMGEPMAFYVHHPSCFLEFNWEGCRVPMREFMASFSGNFIAFERK